MEQQPIRVLWASRHPLDPEAEEALGQELGGAVEVVAKEILWPAGKNDCLELVRELENSGYDILAGVWPAQAIEAFHLLCVCRPVFSPVSEPVTEADGSKTRRFQFVRWARVA